MPCHLLQFGRQLHATNLLEQVTGHVLKQVDHVVLVNKRHLAVDLCKLGLTISAKILVAETFCYLEIAVKARHHEQLLQRLRTLRQSIELTWVHARRHHKVACAFRCAAYEDWGFHLYEVARIKEVANQYGHAVAQLQVFAHA